MNLALRGTSGTGWSRRIHGNERLDYFPYGEEKPGATAQDRYKFGTYYRDTTGLDYANQHLGNHDARNGPRADDSHRPGYRRKAENQLRKANVGPAEE
jgi:hypothetical protein